MKPASFQAFFDRFRADLATGAGDKPAIAIDGKEMQCGFDKPAGQSNMNIVTAFAHGARLTLGLLKAPGAVAGFWPCSGAARIDRDA